MSQKPKILIFYASDGLKDAQNVQKDLLKFDLEVTLLDELLPAKQNNNFYQQVIEGFDKVIFVVSDGLFANCYMLFAAGTARGQNKAVSAVHKDSKVIVPTSYAYAFRNFSTSLTEVITKLFN